MAISFARVAACTDCHLTAAGYTEEELGRTPETTPWSLFDDEPGHPVATAVDEPSFSRSPCEACGSTLDGDRHDDHWLATA